MVIEQSMGEDTEFGQREWHRAGNTVKRTESDKLASLTDYGAQDMTFSGGRVVQDQEKLVMEVKPAFHFQQEEGTAGKDNKFQKIRVFWKEKSGEVDQDDQSMAGESAGQECEEQAGVQVCHVGGQIDGWTLHDHAGGQGEVKDTAAAQPIGVVGQDWAEEQDHPPGVQGGRVQEHGDQPLEHTGDQQQAIDSGQGGGERKTRDGVVQGDSTIAIIVDHQAVVGDGFQQEFRKII